MSTSHGLVPTGKRTASDHTIHSKDPRAPVSKRIVICCDGTWKTQDSKTPSEAPSNVTRLSRAVKAYTDKVDGETFYDSDGNELHRGIPQVVYYQAGVGTDGGYFEKMLEGATGRGLLDNVREAYGFLSHNYFAGDDIILIGFSRGAFTARAIAGLITTLGVLTKKGMKDFYEVFEKYMNKELQDEKVLNEFRSRKDFVHKDVKVKAVGVFDTVGSLGIPETHLFKWKLFNSKFAFFNTDVHPLIENAFHALALDEHRYNFYPTVWKHTPETIKAGVNLKQVWFPGVHSNIGGGYEDQEIADMTLAWMVSELSPFIEFEYEFLKELIDNPPEKSTTEWALGKLYNSADGIFRLAAGRTRKPAELIYTENAQTGESIHPSVRVRMLETEKLAKEDPQRKLKPWNSNALKGWKYVEDEKSGRAYWEKAADAKSPSVRLEESMLGAVEKRLAGERVIKTYLGPTAWEGVTNETWNGEAIEGFNF